MPNYTPEASRRVISKPKVIKNNYRANTYANFAGPVSGSTRTTP